MRSYRHHETADRVDSEAWDKLHGAMEARFEYARHRGKYEMKWRGFDVLYRSICLQTSEGSLLIYAIGVVDTPRGVYNQIDPPHKNLCRDSAELFMKETIPSLTLTLVNPQNPPTQSVQRLTPDSLLSAHGSPTLRPNHEHLLHQHEPDDGGDEE